MELLEKTIHIWIDNVQHGNPKYVSENG